MDKNPITPFDKRSTKVSGISIVGTNSPTTTNPTGTVLYGLTVQSDNGLYGNIAIGTSISTFGITSDITIIDCIFNSLTETPMVGQ
ncbi:MAG: hypothetical protein IPO04_17275 [Cytophagaceae bacterium]|nr:hypothetical protein [Cytophagaceae bacterium]